MSDDLIRRSNAIKVTWQEPSYTDAINALTEARERIYAIPAVESCKDAISRQWLIDNIEKGEEVKGGVFDTDSDSVKNFIKVAPSVTVEPKKGEWIKTSDDWIVGTGGVRYYPIHCSVCNYPTYDDSATNFCPDCGADMRKGTDNE